MKIRRSKNGSTTAHPDSSVKLSARKRHKLKTSAKTGLPPGTLVHIGEKRTDSTQIDVMEFDGDKVVEHSFQVADEVFKLHQAGNPLWISVHGLHDVALIENLGVQFGIHPLVLEDIVNTSQAPVVEFAPGYIFVVLKTIQLEGPESEPDIDQISLVIGPDFVMTFHEDGDDIFDSLRERIRNGRGGAYFSRPDYLAYAVMDVVVDNYFVALDLFGDAIESIEEAVLERPKRALAAAIHVRKRQLLQLRKSIWPVREIMNRLTRENHKLISPETLPFLRDINDHIIQVIDMVEISRDLVSGILDIYLSSISVRMNEVMKVLTIISTIFIPLTFLAGIYGMNFKYMPELESRWGYPAMWTACLIIAGVLLIAFRRKKWI
jgi:magnesium transporter